jgi:hypothetical protein
MKYLAIRFLSTNPPSHQQAPEEYFCIGQSGLSAASSVSDLESADWSVLKDLADPVRARAQKLQTLRELDQRGHHDWPVKSGYRNVTAPDGRSATRKLWPVRLVEP